MTNGLSVLAVDDETPALDELVYLLTQSAMASHVRAVNSATDALHHLHHERFDVVLLDVALGVTPVPPAGPRRVNQAPTLVDAQRLGVDAGQLGRHRDDVDGAAG